MAQVSPALNEVQTVGTSWNRSSRSPSSEKVETVVLSPTSETEVYSVTIDANPSSNLSCSEPLISGDDHPNSPEYGVQPTVMSDDAIGSDDHNSTVNEPISLEKPSRLRSNIDVTLEGADLWHQFYSAGTEMIITRSGRRMFPGIAVSVSGLQPDAKYCINLEVNLADSHRYKFLNSKWVVVGKAEVHSENMLKYIHPDSPASGRHWMANKVSFKKIKVTNNKNSKRGQVVLNSMHRYLPRVVISKCLAKKTSVVVHSQKFPECCFIAVTAYQNDQVTQLKIDHNPFAKAFRDGPNAEEVFGYHGMMNVWAPSSPLLQSGYQGFSTDGPVPMQPALYSPGFQTSPGQSPLPQFSAAFGTWESPPYSPTTYRPSASATSLLSPSGIPVSDPRQLLWNTSRLSQESPPISPLLYSPGMYPAQQGASVYKFPPIEPQMKSPSGLVTNQAASWQRATGPYPAFHMPSSPVGYGPSQQVGIRVPIPQRPVPLYHFAPPKHESQRTSPLPMDQ